MEYEVHEKHFSKRVINGKVIKEGNIETRVRKNGDEKITSKGKIRLQKNKKMYNISIDKAIIDPKSKKLMYFITISADTRKTLKYKINHTQLMHLLTKV